MTTDTHRCADCFRITSKPRRNSAVGYKPTFGTAFHIDLWGGWFDNTRSTPWLEIYDDYGHFFGDKTRTALAALVLVDHGEPDVYSPVARYWPEFAANGKANIEVRQLLPHTIVSATCLVKADAPTGQAHVAEHPPNKHAADSRHRRVG